MPVHLNSIKEILKKIEKNERLLFSCIEDLALNGHTLSRFSPDEPKLARQDFTQFIAGWFKFIGVPEDVCREWLLTYCIQALSEISSSSKSRIKHSTKSNIKYIYGSDASFDCRCEHNIFKANCQKDCPIYTEMEKKYHQLLEAREEETRLLDEIQRKGIEAKKFQPEVSTREKYKEQFENAIKTAVELLKQGRTKRKIVDELNEKGFKTRYGKKWRYSTLINELNPYIAVPSREEFDKTMEFAVQSIKSGIPIQEVVSQLNEKGFKTETGKEWKRSNLIRKLKKYKNKK